MSVLFQLVIKKSLRVVQTLRAIVLQHTKSRTNQLKIQTINMLFIRETTNTRLYIGDTLGRHRMILQKCRYLAIHAGNLLQATKK